MEYKVNDIVKCVVTGVENYGIFVKVEEKYTGLIHISEISRLFIKSVEEYAKVGDEFEAKILEIDEKKHQLKLSMKELEPVKKHKRREQIVETPLGFKTLKENLNRWIEEKY